MVESEGIAFDPIALRDRLAERNEQDFAAVVARERER